MNERSFIVKCPDFYDAICTTESSRRAFTPLQRQCSRLPGELPDRHQSAQRNQAKPPTSIMFRLLSSDRTKSE